MKVCLVTAIIVIQTIYTPSYALADYSTHAKSPGASMQIASLPVDENGIVQAMLDINLESGWITYWREPGASGLAPQISMIDEKNGAVTTIRYPVPKQIMVGDMLDIAYDAPIKLPFTIQMTEGQRDRPVNVSVLIGVCKDICIPFQSEFTIDPLAGQKRIEISQRFSEAVKNLPSSPRADFKVESFALDTVDNSIGLKLAVPEGTDKIDEVIIAGPTGYALTTIKTSEISGATALVKVDTSMLPKSYNPAGKLWHILVRIGDDIIESDLQFPNP